MNSVLFIPIWNVSITSPNRNSRSSPLHICYTSISYFKETPDVITYAIIQPQSDIPLAYLQSAASPTLEALFDHVAMLGGFPDRDALVESNPGLLLGFAILH